jgi:hypothetical protein
VIRLALCCLLAGGCGNTVSTPDQRGHQVNPGARVPVFQESDRNWMGATVGRGALDPMPTGLFLHDPQSIYLAGRWDPVSVHEYHHLIERRLLLAGNVNGARIARQAFRDINAPGYEIGEPDLMEPLP